MPLTDHCDVFGALNEEGINRIVRHIISQRPSLFNYGTNLFVDRPKLLCEPIEAHPEVKRRGNPQLTREPRLTVPGSDGAYGFDYCLQITRLAVDFHPGNAIALPPELGPLGEQRLALVGRACFGLICPTAGRVEVLGDVLADLARRPTRERDDREPQAPQALPGGEPICFCLELFAVLHLERLLRPEGTYLVPRLDGLEIVDIKPQGMEDSIECVVATVLRLAVLPKLRLAIDTLVFDIGGFLSIGVGPTPISPAVPNNPAVEDNQLKVFVEVA